MNLSIFSLTGPNQSGHMLKSIQHLDVNTNIPQYTIVVFSKALGRNSSISASQPKQRQKNGLSGNSVELLNYQLSSKVHKGTHLRSRYMRDMSVVKQDSPAGMELYRAYIHGSQACARESNLVHVLQLMPISKV